MEGKSNCQNRLHFCLNQIRNGCLVKLITSFGICIGSLHSNINSLLLHLKQTLLSNLIKVSKKKVWIPKGGPKETKVLLGRATCVPFLFEVKGKQQFLC